MQPPAARTKHGCVAATDVQHSPGLCEVRPVVLRLRPACGDLVLRPSSSCSSAQGSPAQLHTSHVIPKEKQRRARRVVGDLATARRRWWLAWRSFSSSAHCERPAGRWGGASFLRLLALPWAGRGGRWHCPGAGKTTTPPPPTCTAGFPLFSCRTAGMGNLINSGGWWVGVSQKQKEHRQNLTMRGCDAGSLWAGRQAGRARCFTTHDKEVRPFALGAAFFPL